MTSAFEGGTSLIESWLRNKNTVEFLGVWERLNNPSFNSPEFEGIRNKAGLNRFTLSAKGWVDKTSGIGLIAKTGRYDWTNDDNWVHSDAETRRYFVLEDFKDLYFAILRKAQEK